MDDVAVESYTTLIYCVSQWGITCICSYMIVHVHTCIAIRCRCLENDVQIVSLGRWPELCTRFHHVLFSPNGAIRTPHANNTNVWWYHGDYFRLLVKKGGKTYFMVVEGTSWEDANLKCSQQMTGGHIALIDDHDTYSELKSTFPGNTEMD